MKSLRWRMAVLAFLSASAVNAAPPFPKATVTWGPVYESSSAKEFVYAATGSSTKMSELDWPSLSDPNHGGALGVSVDVGVDWSPSFRTLLELAGDAPTGTGTMTDDDWKIYDNSGDLMSRVHSDSTSYLTSRWSVRYEAGVPLRWGNVETEILGGFLYEHFAWEAWNTTQTQTYAVNGSTATESWTGLSISFRQEWWIPYLGAQVRLPSDGLDWFLGIRASPLAQGSQSDSHILRQLNFNETLRNGWFVEPNISVSWPVVKGWKAVVDVRYLGLFGFRGDETVSQDGATASGTSPFQSASDSAGGQLQAMQVRMMIQSQWGGDS